MSRDEKDAIWLKELFWSPPLSDGWRGLCSAPVAVPLPHIYRLQNKTFQTQLKKVCPLYHQLSCSYMQSKQHQKNIPPGDDCLSGVGVRGPGVVESGTQVNVIISFNWN